MVVTSRRTMIPIEVSARHVHLSRTTLELLFGRDFVLEPLHSVSQPGEFASTATVTVLGPKGRLDAVRVMGPPRREDQIELSATDEHVLGLLAPVRDSGDLKDTPGVTLESPNGRLVLSHGVIVASRHIHMSVEDAARFGVRDHDLVAARVASGHRELVFEDVRVRVSPRSVLEMHLDTDEANAAGVESGSYGMLEPVPSRA
jgi:propanediol utilization protein